MMLNKQKINDFWAERTKIADSRIATHYKHDSALDYDAALLKRYCTTDTAALDMGCGTGDLTVRVLPHVRMLVAVEQQANFLTRFPDAPNLTKIASDLMEFRPTQTFDLIYLFGVVNFLTPEDEAQLYANAHDWLNPGGVLLTKHACGVEREVVVDKHSEELGSWYHARYPHVPAQQTLLAHHFTVETIDIYPPEMNRWSNTHYYAFAAHKAK